MIATYCSDTWTYAPLTAALGARVRINNSNCSLSHALQGLSAVSLSFGDYLSGTAFFPEHAPVNAGKPLPAIVWLHPYSYNTGYTPSYRQAHPHFALASAGAVVLAYDQACVCIGPMFCLK